MAFYPCTNNEIDKLINGTITNVKSNVSVIKPYTFYGCENLITVSLPNILMVTTQTFRNCRQLTEVDISSCTLIQANAFNGCTSLEEIDLPMVQSIQASAFGACANFDTVILRYNNVVSVYTNSLAESQFDENGTGGKIYVPQAQVSSYQADAIWSTIIAKNANNQILAIEGSPYEN
jgi:hypothetical protein